MAKKLNVSSFEEMERSSQKLQSLSESYSDISNQLLDQAQTMGAAWEGVDNQAFVDQIMGCQDKLRKMSEKLSTASQTLKQQKDNYMNFQSDNVSQVGKLIN